MDRIFADVRSVMRGEAAGSVKFAVLFRSWRRVRWQPE